MDKPLLSLDLLNGSIAHIEGLKAKTELLLGKKNLLSDAIITMDFAGHSYDYSEMLVMRDKVLLNTACNATTTAHQAWKSPEDAIQSIRLAREKMDLLDEERTRLIKEHVSQYVQDIFSDMHNLDDLPCPRPFFRPDYLDKEMPEKKCLNGLK